MTNPAEDSFFELVKPFDNNVLTAINFDGSNAYDQFWWLYTNKLTWIPLAVVAVYYLLRRGGWKHALLLTVLLAALFAMSDALLSSLIRPMIGRARPSHDPSIMNMLSYVNDYRGGPFGFPSNHASNGFAIATMLALAFRHRATTVCAFLWAIGSCYSRLYLGVHFPTDILCGALTGSLLAVLVYYIYCHTYLYIASRTFMPPFESIHQNQRPWGIAVTFGLTVLVLLVMAIF